MDSDQVIPVDSIKSAVALDWDHNSNSIFWTDVEKDTINRAYLNGSHQTIIVGSNLSKSFVEFQLNCITLKKKLT